MYELSLDGLTQVFRSDYAQEAKYVGVAVMLPGAEKPEVIINPQENFASKLAYYQQAYNDDLTLKANGQIRIVSYAFGDSFEELEGALAG